MKILSRGIKIVFSIYAALILLALILVLFPIALLLNIFPKNTRGNLLYRISRFAVDIAMLLWGIYQYNIYAAPHDRKKPMIFVFNHISYLDALTILKAIRFQHMRGLGKSEIGDVPIAGLIYRSAVIMVKRTSAEDRARSIADLKEALKHNISIALAPEGTFNETGKPLLTFFDGAFKIAIETQTPIKPLLFLDTYDRLNYNSILSLTPGQSRVVYLEEIPVAGYTMEDVPVLKQKVYDVMEKALIAYKASWIKE
jgi:1-acyl-sn-glycerol-3-phosphate acyltransferase